MSNLTGKTCEVCRIGAPLATQQEIDELMPQLQGWELIETDGIKRLIKTFRFDNFEEALSFTNKVGLLSEQEGHHPSILTEWGKVTLSWWSHKIKGLHVNDFVMAAKTDALGMGKENSLGTPVAR
ncbi:MAG: 4a-hydroxytetrahydrobiopterin dehydratase [Gammaproteobacteria bacterium HGW-Gammaproteobacteria-3]|nr:MAG: 4a-hydroxytetrahydrobiopterin dehydratase [Gammaproteobacteria bacterium HGW-Gammaproteobacteria-3]